MGLIGYFFNLAFTFPILNVLLLLYHFVGDFGLSIILLTIVLYFLLLPLTRRQLKMMKITQAMQPELAEIRRQHAGDLQAQTEATQALYQRYGFRPSSSFLPLLVQAPIFTGLYASLNIVLNHTRLAQLNSLIYPFLPQLTSVPNIDLNWFTVFNAAWHISLGLPDPSHILPILAGVVTFVQMRMAQPHALTETKEAMMQVAQVTQFLLPFFMVLVTIFITWHFAAGIALYRAVSLFLNMIQQYFVTGWGSLLTVPHFASNVSNSAVKSNGSIQQTQPRPTSSSHKEHIPGKSASARRRGKASKKNRRRD